MAMNPTDDASHPAELRANFLANLLLLQELHGILVFAISKAGLDELKAFVCAELATLGLKLGLVSPALCQLEQLDDVVLEKFAEHLDETLVSLNEMVAEDLAINYKQSAPGKDAWSRLTLLHDIIASRYKAVSATAEDKSMIGSDSYFSDDKLCSYLMFNMRITEQDVLLKNLSYLNHHLDELLATTHRRSSVKVREMNTTEEEEDGDDVMLAKQAQDYRQQISSLYKVLAKNMGACEKEHMAQLCLSNFGVDKNTLDIYISMCCEPTGSQAVTWHPTKWFKKEPCNHAVTNSIDGSLCQYLHTARAKRLPATLAYSGETLSEDSIEVCRLPQEDLLWSFVDLATVLDEIPSETKPSGQISSVDKLRLQCLLTQSILFLHPSFWMPEALNLSNIHFTTTKSARNLKNPYIYCAFQDVPEEYSTPDTEVIVDFMIHFGLLLLQIEVGRPLSLLPEEQTNQYGYELALDRYIEQFSDDLNIHIKKVLLDCLWFKKRCLGQISNAKMPLDLKIRFAVSQHILKPLIGSLEFNYPNVAREILPYTIEQHQQPQKVKTKPMNPPPKRKADNDSEEFLRPQTNKVNMTAAISKIQLANYSSSSTDTVGVLLEQPIYVANQNSYQGSIHRNSNVEFMKPKRIGNSRSNLSQSVHTYPASLHNTLVSSQPEDYTVGWISAIPIEKAVACEMLDEEYSRERWPFFDTQHDHNSYTFGRLHGHNIVIACLPKGRYGNTSASIVAQHMRTSFPAIRFGLMVGIAGGAPSQKHDVRLGDIVVSSPTPRHCGVIQYDYGKAVKHHDFEETGHMTPPPEMLLTALANLEAQHKRKGHRVAETVTNMLERNNRLRTEYTRPDEQTDRLYKASYKHYENDLCDCEISNTGRLSAGFTIGETTRSADDSQDSVSISRGQRAPDRDNIAIHHGLIASANRLMKDADARDALVQKYDVLCFEMEAAGLVNSFPCVVIRGICDYSDSHKNDLWQGYAAANAAAYAKELLEIIPSQHVKNPRSSP